MRELRTERLLLRPVIVDDTETIFRTWANDPEVTKYMTWEPHPNVEETRRIMAMWLEDYKDPDCYRYGIERLEDGVLMGMIDVVGYEDGVPEIGYCSGKAFWGNGYMTEALGALVTELFEDGYETLRIAAVRENIGSNRVIQKNGFTFLRTRTGPTSQYKPQEIVTINEYVLHRKDWI